MTAPSSERSSRGTRLRWRDRLVVAIGIVAIRLLGPTWRVRRIDDALVAECRAARRPIVFAFWHGSMLPLLYCHRNENVTLLASSHCDGEIIARVVRAFGCPVVRGSTSRHASGALRALIDVVRAGGDLGITPDGPRGPAFRFAPGAAIMAFEGGAPVILIAVAVDRAWRLRSWDRFMIPKPFARLTLAYQSITIDGPTAREAAEQAPAIGVALEALTRRAEVALG